MPRKSSSRSSNKRRGPRPGAVIEKKKKQLIRAIKSLLRLASRSGPEGKAAAKEIGKVLEPEERKLKKAA